MEQLSLVDFRNYAAADLRLHPGPNAFVGRNGQGKTNLAEAVAYFATLGSHRVWADAPMVRHGADAAIIRERLAHGDRHVLLEVQINRQGSNRARVNGSPVKPGELPRYAQVVLFAPEDLQIVRGDPSARRRFADQLLVQRTPRFSAVMADYDRVLRQRNALLKSARARGIRADKLGTLDVWDDKLITLGAQIVDARSALTEHLAGPVCDAYAAIAGADHAPRLRWERSIDDIDADAAAASVDGPDDAGSDTAAAFSAALARLRGAELERGVTLAGPHRDDLVLSVRGLPVKGYASHGESWSVALALRLASARLLREQSRLGDPVLILDDVFAELDSDRRDRLATLVAEYEQVIVTAAVGTDIPDALRAHVVHVRDGAIDPGSDPDDVDDPRDAGGETDAG